MIFGSCTVFTAICFLPGYLLHYNRYSPWTLFGTTWVSRYQKFGKPVTI